MALSVELHPQRKQIERDILAGIGYREIAKRVSPPVSPATLQRYGAKMLKPALEKRRADLIKQVSRSVAEKADGVAPELIRSETEQRLSAQPFVRQLQAKYDRYGRWFKGAEEKEDWRALAALDGAETRTIELDARLHGALDTASQNAQTINIAVVLPAPVQPATGSSGVTLDIAAVKVDSGT